MKNYFFLDFLRCFQKHFNLFENVAIMNFTYYYSKKGDTIIISFKKKLEIGSSCSHLYLII